MDRIELDLAIVGGGLAGNLLARQLRRRLPDLRVGLFEKSTERTYKVGESTVEIASHYLVRRVGLSRYLYENHLPKNGLRYFFDDAERSTPLEHMSEVGTINLPFHPAFQIDRARMEADLLEMNRADGVRVALGTRVEELSLGEGGAPHSFRARDDAGEDRVTCRWLVDASGRASLLARTLDLRVPEEIHRIGAVWGRFEGVADVDEQGDEGFRSRVRHTCRGISTIHFCYPGYWIWFIPLRGGITSVGVVGEIARNRALQTPEGFRGFLDEHAAARSLLAGAKAIDLGSFNQIAYGTRRFFHPDRFALIGEAATAADPLYSPGSDFIALENDFLTDLVAREADGEPAGDIEKRLALYDGFMTFRHEAAMRLYRGLYGTLGSFEMMRMKWDFDIGCYHNLWVAPYMQDQYLDDRFVRQQLRQRRAVLQALTNFATLFAKVEDHLHTTGHYHRANRGAFSYGLENIDFLEQIGLPRSRRTTLEQTAKTFNLVRGRALELLGGNGEASEPLPLLSFMVDRPLV